MLHSFPSSLFEGRLRRHPEGGAGSGVLRRRLVTACLGRPGTPPARHYDLAARSSLHGSEGNCPPVEGGGRPSRRKRGPEAKNRHGGAPRGERPASWDARRLASAWPAASCAGPTGVPPSTRTSLGAPPTPLSGERSNDANPGRGQRAAGTRWAV